MKKRGGDEQVDHALLKESILKHISYLQSKAYLQEREVYSLVKDFFKEYLGLNYEFTHDELAIELQNVFYKKDLEDKVLNFLRQTSKIEYSDEEYSEEELKKILESFKKIVEELIKVKKKEKNFLQKLLFWKEHKESEVPFEREEQEEIIEAIEDLESDQGEETKPDLFSHKKRVVKHPRKEVKKNNEKQEMSVKKPEEKPTSSSGGLSQISELAKSLNESTKEHSKESVVPKTKKESKETTERKTEKKLVDKEEKILKQKVLEEKKETIAEENKKIQEKPSKKKKDSENVKKLLKKLKSAKGESAKELYTQIKNQYETMSEQDKKKNYEIVTEAYELLESALSSKKDS